MIKPKEDTTYITVPFVDVNSSNVVYFHEKKIGNVKKLIVNGDDRAILKYREVVPTVFSGQKVKVFSHRQMVKHVRKYGRKMPAGN